MLKWHNTLDTSLFCPSPHLSHWLSCSRAPQSISCIARYSLHNLMTSQSLHSIYCLVPHSFIAPCNRAQCKVTVPCCRALLWCLMKVKFVVSFRLWDRSCNPPVSVQIKDDIRLSWSKQIPLPRVVPSPCSSFLYTASAGCSISCCPHISHFNHKVLWLGHPAL